MTKKVMKRLGGVALGIALGVALSLITGVAPALAHVQLEHRPYTAIERHV